MSLGNTAGTCIYKEEEELQPGATFDKAKSAQGAVPRVASPGNVNETIHVSQVVTQQAYERQWLIN